MRIVHSWLQQYIKFTLPPEVLAERLGMLGLEIENIDRLGEKYDGFVVGKVLEKSKHPNADKLSVCSADIGKEVLQIVCGGPNVEVGQKVAVGKIGATVPRNQHDPSGKPFVLSRAKVRGLDSFGMICSAYELDLGEDAQGILVLDSSAKIGQPLAQYLGLDDIAYDIEVTPNRPDWLSHIGVAREIGVILRKKTVTPLVKLKEGKIPIARHLSVTVEDTVNCRRFGARMIRGVTIRPSPPWLQQALTKAGLRPRNNVVDVTNYVMLECGQPLHAFDYALLKGGKIVVRQAMAKNLAEAGYEKKFVTLDGKEHTLAPETVMVCDAEREVSIAGVMGGENSEIRETTQDVVIESANWNPSSIRRTSKSLGISTDASQRFERGADPEAVVYALNRAAQLMLDLAGGTLLKGLIDIYPKKIREREVPLRPERANALLGTSLSKAAMMKMLGLLDIVPVRTQRERVLMKIPTHRVDIDREVDLIEEIARVFGYDKIEEKTTVHQNLTHPFPTTSPSEAVREALIGLGFQEAITIPLVDDKRAALDDGKPVGLINPQNSDMRMLRTSLVPGLLATVAHNISFGNLTLRLFEIGHVFGLAGSSTTPGSLSDVDERELVCLAMTGLSTPSHWSIEERQVDIFDLKGELMNLLSKFALDKSLFISYSTSDCLAENAVAVEINGSKLGYFGNIRDDMLKLFGIEQQVFIAELNINAFAEKRSRNYQPLPRYPKVRRDIAFVVDRKATAQEVESAIRSAATDLVQDVELFDVYEGENIPEGKKSLAFALALMSREKTLTEAEIESAVQAIVRQVEKKLGASLRSL